MFICSPFLLGITTLGSMDNPDQMIYLMFICSPSQLSNLASQLSVQWTIQTRWFMLCLFVPLPSYLAWHHNFGFYWVIRIGWFILIKPISLEFPPTSTHQVFQPFWSWTRSHEHFIKLVLFFILQHCTVEVFLLFRWHEQDETQTSMVTMVFRLHGPLFLNFIHAKRNTLPILHSLFLAHKWIICWLQPFNFLPLTFPPWFSPFTFFSSFFFLLCWFDIQEWQQWPLELPRAFWMLLAIW